jgi:hypothetical protein
MGEGKHAGWVRSSDVCEKVWIEYLQPLALDVCPSWIHGQHTKEAVLLNDDGHDAEATRYNEVE